MKKLWAGFGFISAMIALAAGAGIFLTLSGAAVLGIIISAAAVTAEIWFLMYFGSIRYIRRGGDIFVKSGVLFGKLRHIPADGILWTNSVSLCRIPLATILHTGGGSVILFAETDIFCEK